MTILPPYTAPDTARGPNPASVRETTLQAVAKNFAMSVQELETELQQHGDITIGSVAAHAIVARIATELGIPVPKLAKLPRESFCTYNAIANLTLEELGKRSR